MELITYVGWVKLNNEYTNLMYTVRPPIVNAVSDAAKLGDRSENAEYIYGKKKLREIDKRITYILKRMKILKVISTPPERLDKIFFGATVVLIRDSDDEIVIYSIVGIDEIDFTQGKISIATPVAKSLIGKTIGDSIIINHESYTIDKIEYNFYKQ